MSTKPVESADTNDLVITRVLRAPVAALWRAWTEPDLLKEWWCPKPWTTEVRAFDLRPGGDWLCHFPGGSTGGGTILSFIPQKQLVISALAPDKFPNVRAHRTTAKFSFKAEGNATSVRLTQTGWQQGEEWNKAYEYLAAGNAQLLAMLHHRFVSGPTDWSKMN